MPDHLFFCVCKYTRSMFLVYHIVEKNKIQKVVCANQSHLMQMVDGWGFQRVLHYSSPTGVEGVVYCHAVGDSALADREMCLVVTAVSKVHIRLHDIYVLCWSTTRPTPTHRCVSN